MEADSSTQLRIEARRHNSVPIGPNQVSKIGQSTASMEKSTGLVVQPTLRVEQSTDHHELPSALATAGDTLMVCDSELPPAV